MAQGNTKSPPPASVPAPLNGQVHAPAPATVNRKKQKRREKQAAKQAAEAMKNGGAPPSNGPAASVHSQFQHGQPAPRYSDPDHEDDPENYDDEHDYYSEDDAAPYGRPYANGHRQPSYSEAPPGGGTKKKSKKKKRGSSAAQQAGYHPTLPDMVSRPAQSISNSKRTDDRIWSTSSQEERERIREFWLSLGEEERKSLVKIEKEAVLRKMKEQQKHSCSCTVCGRKRTAIEEELEVLYDAYYEELEQYAHHQQEGGPHLLSSMRNYLARRPRQPNEAPNRIPVPQHYEEPDDLSHGEEDDGDDDLSEEGISSDDVYDSEGQSSSQAPEADFLQFGSSLQVKGGILTVADDLLKNDGKKFIEMMEQLAERRMQREEDARFASEAHSYSRTHASHNHGPPPPDDEDDYDEEEDDEDYVDGDYDEDEEEEDDTMTEEQRMEEGRRMFQIFAARMFEQRVLQAYREKVAAERQQKLLEELAEEDEATRQAEAKKAKEAQKRKEKKEKQKLAKAEEKARKEAEQAAKEAEAKAAEEKRLEEQRKKKEEQRKKKEAERKAQEEEKLRKEAERLRRQQEERERQQELERKQREIKAQEKKAKEEARRKEREEREAKEKEAREKKAQEEKERREREAKAKAERERIRKEEQAAATARKSAQPGVALPPGLLKQNSSTGVPSPHVTPALPKAPTPSRPRQSSQQGSHGSSPKTPHVAPGTGKSISPASQIQNPLAPKSILTKPPTSQQPTPMHQMQPSSPMPPIGPPPGMHGVGLGMNMPPGLNGFHHAPSPMLPPVMAGPRHGMSHNMPMFAPQPGAQVYRGFPPPGVHVPSPMSMGRGYPVDGPPPGFAAFGGPHQMPSYGMGFPTHSRQASGSHNVDPPAVGAIGQNIPPTPAPIGRPSSVKPHEGNRHHQRSDVDELQEHLGSKALLDDAEDEPLEPPRRTSLQTHPGIRAGSIPIGFGFPDASAQTRSDSFASFGAPSNAGSVWGTPPMAFLGGPSGWGNSPTSGISHSPLAAVGAPRNGEPRLAWIHRLLISACKSMAHRQASPDGFLDAIEVHQAVEQLRNQDQQPIDLQEIKEACELMDGHLEGPRLEYKEVSPNSGQISHIRYAESSGSGPSTVFGEIGSPVPVHSVPAGSGFQRFPGLGPQGF